MRYIEKGETPQYITDWITLRKSADQSLDYDEFNQKNRLNEDLRKEQHGLCCYCQKRIDHFQGDIKTGAHNEHLIPQSGSTPDQMNYNNIYACCIESKGEKKRSHQQHCGESKGKKFIRPFIQEENCVAYFRYNSLGEIIPNGTYGRFVEYEEHIADLNDDEKDALACIQTLNLNCLSLRSEREKAYIDLIEICNIIGKDAVRTRLKQLLSTDTYPEFVELLLQVAEI